MVFYVNPEKIVESTIESDSAAPLSCNANATKSRL